MGWPRVDEPRVPPAGPGEPRRRPRRRGSTRPSRRSSTTPAARCWCWPARAPARPPRSSRPVAARIEARASTPSRSCVLTFSRKAAAELRTRITARSPAPSASRSPAPSTPTPTACSARAALLRGDPPPRLLTSAEQDVGGARAAARRRRGARAPSRWPAALAPALETAGFRRELRDLLLRATERGVGPDQLAAWGREPGREHWVHAAAFQEQYEAVTAFSTAGRATRRATTRPSWSARRSPSSPATRSCCAQERERARWLFVDEYQDTDPAQVELLELLAGGGDEPGRRRRPRPGDLRLPRRRAARHRRVPRALPAHRRPARPRGSRSASAAAPGADCCAISRTVAEGLPGPWEHRRLAPAAGHRAGERRGARRSAPPRSRRRTSPTCCGGRTCSTACPWSQMAVLVRSRRRARPLRRALTSAGVRSRSPPTSCRSAAQPAVAPLLRALRALLPPRCPAEAGGDAGEPAVDEPAAEALLASPLGGATRARPAPAAPRGPHRARRAGHRRRRAGRPAGHRARPTRRCSRRCPSTSPGRPGGWPACSPQAGSRWPRDGTAEDVLWAVWQAQRAGRAVGPGAAPAGGPARRGRRPRPRRGRRAVRRGRRLRRPAAARPTSGRSSTHLAAQQMPGDTGAARGGRPARRSGC